MNQEGEKSSGNRYVALKTPNDLALIGLCLKPWSIQPQDHEREERDFEMTKGIS